MGWIVETILTSGAFPLNPAVFRILRVARLTRALKSIRMEGHALALMKRNRHTRSLWVYAKEPPLAKKCWRWKLYSTDLKTVTLATLYERTVLHTRF